MLKSLKKRLRKSIVKSLCKDIQAENLERHRELEAELESIREQLGIPNSICSTDPQSKISFSESLASVCDGFDLIIAHYEICSSHGVGVLLKRLFEGKERIASVRSGSQYGNETIGDMQIELKHAGRSRRESYMAVGDALRFCSVKRILCVPYFSDDVITAITASDIFDAPLCLYLMDDQNITTDEISDALMREIIEKVALRLAIGPEMKAAYEKKYGQKFWILPPNAPPEFISDAPPPVPSTPTRTGVLLGNVWSEKWLNDLRKSMRESETLVHWFVDPAKLFIPIDEEELAGDGLHIQGFLEGQPLKDRLQQEYAFAIVPSGSADPDDTHQWQAALSLPSRVPFLMATSNIPLIVLAVKDTPATNFVRRFGIGEVCDYDPENVRKTVEAVCAPEAQRKYRANAARVARAFSSEGIADWIWESLELGRACDDRFERLFGETAEGALSADTNVSSGT